MKDNSSNSTVKRPRGKIILVLIVVGAGAVALAHSGFSSRENAEKSLANWTQEQATPSVDVVMARRGIDSQELTLPGDVEAWFKAPIYARVSGYIKMWYKDFGAHVKAGDVLAEIDSPDLDQKLAQARADLDKAKADAALSEITARRWQALQRSNAVSQQEIDEKTGAYRARQAEVSAAEAYVGQLEAFERYKKLTAPFDGVVTARKVDVGALVQSSASNTPDLFEISDVHEMRIFVSVPQAFVSQLQVGMKAHFTLRQFPSRTFEAILATTSDAISQGSRSLLVELHYDNKEGLLQPGSYAEVHFELPPDKDALVLPASALLFRQNGAQVAVVGVDDKVVLKKIEIGRDLGSEMEITAGLSASDHVIDNPSDSISTGDVVHVATSDENLPRVSAR